MMVVVGEYVRGAIDTAAAKVVWEWWYTAWWWCFVRDRIMEERVWAGGSG
jgi:hypothetical protein